MYLFFIDQLGCLIIFFLIDISLVALDTTMIKYTISEQRLSLEMFR